MTRRTTARRPGRRAGLAALIATCAVAPSHAQTATAADASPPSSPAPTPAPRLAQRADELVAILNGGGEVGRSFAPGFLAQIPEAQVRAISAQLVTRLGAATGIGALDRTDADAAAIRVTFERGSATMTLAIEADPVGRITGLRVTGVDEAAVAALATLDAVAAAIRELPGRSGFIVADPDARAIAAAVAPDRPLAIGSTFKLVVLAELVRAVDAGERRWDDPVPLDGLALPSGRFRGRPAGTQVPLRDLAEAMIAVSDNSAADALIHALGRGRIETMQATVGVRDGARNTPFLTVLEAFKLKYVGAGALAARYAALDMAGRRALLAGDIAATPDHLILPLTAGGRPAMIDRVEWFAAPADLVRVMTWFRDHGETPGGREALRILALNPGPAGGLPEPAYVGYKGGSEPGVIGMTLLLRDRTGGWRVVSAGWNDPEAPVDEARFAGLVRRAVELSTATE